MGATKQSTKALKSELTAGTHTVYSTVGLLESPSEMLTEQQTPTSNGPIGKSLTKA